MLFATNRTPKGSPRTKIGRKISFPPQDTRVSQSMHFCERIAEDDYREIGRENFFQSLKDLPSKAQILFFIHGFNNIGERDIFPKAQALQELLNSAGGKDLVYVVPLIWPCDNDNALAILDDYYDDQHAATDSSRAFARMFAKFIDWRGQEKNLVNPCMRRINLLSHSMGNRVLANALNVWEKDYASQGVPQIFRNIFMLAPDIVNKALEEKKIGQYIPDAARNVVVYYANDDLAMAASKIANIKNRILTRRLGMTGPRKMKKVPKNVYEVDCDDFNNKYDPPKGHTYFLYAPDGKTVSPIIEHMASAIRHGRVSPNERSTILKSNL